MCKEPGRIHVTLTYIFPGVGISETQLIMIGPHYMTVFAM